ncbi:early activation antigen CD69 isoform X2 [Chaetodon trifascialis]|uniref:early activation antigen CD69 isoform X2 n=1 Tax=Chaetodon trifascialis TaxID=109706 RepID=UPI003992876A
MYIKFCRSYGEDKKEEADDNVSPKSKLSVDLDGEKDKQIVGNTRLYRAVCVLLAIISLILLLVIIILGVKLQKGPAECPEREGAVKANRQSPSFTSTCSYEQCQAHLPSIEVKYRSCPQCANGWVTFDGTCFFLSTFRLSWDESQKNCSSRGGSLAVVNDPLFQYFLTKEGKMNYWIGLRKKNNAWTWINNAALQKGYWADDRTEGDCGILNSGDPPEKNWVTASCQAYTYFICQMRL